jgi:hypothetical protein
MSDWNAAISKGEVDPALDAGIVQGRLDVMHVDAAKDLVGTGWASKGGRSEKTCPQHRLKLQHRSPGSELR